MINTHEKLMTSLANQQMSKEQLLERLQQHGYMGDMLTMSDLLYAVGRTDYYINGTQHWDEKRSITGGEYFGMLADELNLNF